MKLGIVCHSTVGGSGTIATELGRALVRHGHSVHIIARSKPPGLRDAVEPVTFHAAEASEYPLFSSPHEALVLATRIAEVALRERLDLIHVHYALPHALSAYLAREMLRGIHPLPVVTTLHGTDVTGAGNDASYKAVTQFGIEKSDGVTAVSTFLAQACLENFQLHNVRVIPNFVDVQRFRPGAAMLNLREQLKPHGEKLLIHVSNFRPIKRASDCVKIFAGVARKLRSRLLMVGNGPDLGSAQAMAHSLGVQDDVIFVGEQSDVVDYLAQADVLLLPSESEAFGLAALEAMSCGVPVVGSRVGGLPEVVRDSLCGYLLPMSDVSQMSDKVLEIFENEQLANSLGAFGRSIALEQFAADRIVPLYLEYYREVIAQFGPHPGSVGAY